MITGEIKNKIDQIWTDIWAGGITQPLTVIIQKALILDFKMNMIQYLD